MKVALIQASPVLFQLEESIAKVACWTEKAAAQGARLILFPEAFLPGYPRGLRFGTVVGQRLEEGREQWLSYWKNAVSIPGSVIERLGQIAHENQVYLIIGVVEKNPGGGTLYCTLLYFSPDGKLLHKHRKLKPTAAERIIWGEGDGKDLQVIDSPIGRIGGLICWENYMPLARMALYQQHVELYLAPTADQRDSWQATLRHIACEGRCFVLGCNQFVTKDKYPEPFQDEIRDLPDILCRGGSAVVNPYGQIIAGPLWDKEGIVLADLKLEDCIKGKLDFDVNGHYQRPDVFSYRWNENG